MKFRNGEMLEYKTPDMPKFRYVMVKSAVDAEKGIYECFAISPGFELSNTQISGEHLTRFL